MHEQSSTHQVRETILDHPRVQSMDPHELHSLNSRLSGMSHPQLVSELSKVRQP